MDYTNLPRELSLRFSAVYLPEQNLPVGEQMIETKSQISVIQYISKTPPKTSIKVCVLCEAKT